MRRLKSKKARVALTTFGALVALCIPAAQASAIVPTWHLGQLNLSEVGKTVEFSSAGTVTVSSKALGTSLELKCQAAGAGALGGESTLTLQGCETYLGGVREKNCDPTEPTTIKFSASMQNEKATIRFPSELVCPLNSKTPIQPGEMKLEAGKEAIHLPVSVSESTKVGAEPGTLTGSITMSLKAPFELRGFGGGSAPLLHLNGKTLAELGKTEVSFSSEDSLTIKVGKFLGTYSCNGSGIGILGARGPKQEELTLECVLVGAEKDCYVRPLHLGLKGSFEDTESVIGTLQVENRVGHTCSAAGSIPIARPYGYLSYGPESTSLSVQKYAETTQSEPTTLSGESHWYVEGGGSKLGIW